MQIVSAREFRANQGKFLTAAREGQSVLLTSRYGNFKITPVTDEDTLTTSKLQAKIDKARAAIKAGESVTLKSKEDIDAYFAAL